MKQKVITLDLSQKDALQSHKGIRGEDGYVVLTPFKPGLSTSANYKRNKRFLEDLKKANYAHFPVWGGFNVYENNELKNKRPLMVRAFIIINTPRASSQAYENSDRLNELGQELCKKYGQLVYLCKQKETGNNVYLVNPAGQTLRIFISGSMIESADSYFSNFSESGLYGKHEERYEFLADRLYVPATPGSLGEAYKRYGEIFIRF